MQTTNSALGLRVGQTAEDYVPVGRLRTYELFIFGVVSLVDDTLWRLVLAALLELPQRPCIVLAGDVGQLQPLGRAGRLQGMVEHAPVE